MPALNLTCGFEYARLCVEDQFLQLSCSRGQCACHATIKEQAGAGSRLSTGVSERVGRESGRDDCHAQVCVCVYACGVHECCS